MKKGLSLFVTSTIIISNIGMPANISYADSNKVSKIRGKDRYETCAEISKKSFEKSDVAVIISGENYPVELWQLNIKHLFYW
ncbi:cell wall-binding repeat-containing protein [Peptostreptococcus canis]|uniref:Cell wall-binding repeat-containing protein n=1 Tax=Peptostreptococcus canis TaxID=1159213 RepID=A0ABR6TN73_9FIRM|nr:cell wall-binding repeat-containing protein [Peptostreptococcus canis]MBC2576871.1 cell wall-binding repeat-containing protein [Peptostreptococcus canis]MBP1998639.1 putative cell wall-binding protein [Peptostreptococcus canis]